MGKINNLKNWTNQMSDYLSKKHKIKKDTILEIIIDWEDKKENLLIEDFKLIKLELPINKIIINSKSYKLIIIDNKGIHYYFTEDGYDGYSEDLIIPIENNFN